MRYQGALSKLSRIIYAIKRRCTALFPGNLEFLPVAGWQALNWRQVMSTALGRSERCPEFSGWEK
jgi:hypothetical protein